MLSAPNRPALTFPLLAYIGEVPVRSISAGPAVLFRLFETYPVDRLVLFETADNRPHAANQLPGVRHEPFVFFRRRLLSTRFSAWYASWIYGTAAQRARALAPRVRAVGAEAVVTVAHGFTWLVAARVARLLRLPLHLIAHDHWVPSPSRPAWFAARAAREFGVVYRQAASRLPVSPAMASRYEALYHAAGTVLYPSQSARLLRITRPPLRSPEPGAFVFAYAGSIPEGLRRALIDFANVIAPLGARLRIYQGFSLDQFRRDGLVADNIDPADFRRADALQRDLIANADALYLPMSFLPGDRHNVELCFPSKLADYTSVGLPILVRSPEYGSAACWALENPGSCELVTIPDAGPLAHAARRLIDDGPYRHRLAFAALSAGEKCFDHAAIYGIFLECLRHP